MWRIRRRHPTAGTRRRNRLALNVAVLLLLLIPGLVLTESQPVGEYRIKAALLHKLGRFVHWPEGGFSAPDAPLVICVLGDDPFGPALDALAGRKAGGREITVQRIPDSLEATRHCHILFIAGSERARLGKLLKELGQRPLFTVSDIQGFARRGGMLQMYTAATRIRFVINRDSAERAGLRIAAPLLDLAEIVGRVENGED